MILILCEILLCTIVYFEYRKFKLIAAPVTILGGIYLLFMPLINLIGSKMGFISLTEKTIMLFTFFIFVLFCSGQVWVTYYTRNRKKVGSQYLKEKLFLHEKIIWKIYILSLVCYVISLLQVISRYGINDTKSHAYGPFAHIGFISRVLLPIILLYLIEKRKLKYIICVLVHFIALVMFKGKYHLYIPIGSFIILFFMLRQNIKITKVIKVVLISFVSALVFFISVYTIIPNIVAGGVSKSSMSAGILFSTKHFFHYLFCPFIASNEYFNNPLYRGVELGMKTNFNPLDVLYEQFLGNKKFFDPAISFWPIVDNLGSTGNVGGMFSESVLNIGYVGAICFVFGIGFIVYYFIIKTLVKGKRILTSICLAGMLMMSFFCNYFTLFANFECLVYCYILDIVIFDVKFKIGKNSIIYRG